jgi:ParB family chromosome partitioning protein
METGNIRTELIDPPKEPMRFENDMEKIDELAQSIRRIGLINPITVNPKGHRYEIIAGNRRYWACRKIGMKTILCRIWVHESNIPKAVQITENIQRVSTTPLEEAQAIQKLLEENEYTQKQVANMLGKSEAWISQRLEIQNWEPQLYEAVKNHIVPYSLAREIHTVKNESLKNELIEKALYENLTIECVKAYVKAQETVDASNTADQKEDVSNQKTILEKAIEATRKGKCECCGRTPGIVALSYIAICQECIRIMLEGANNHTNQL